MPTLNDAHTEGFKLLLSWEINDLIFLFCLTQQLHWKAKSRWRKTIFLSKVVLETLKLKAEPNSGKAWSSRCTIRGMRNEKFSGIHAVQMPRNNFSVRSRTGNFESKSRAQLQQGLELYGVVTDDLPHYNAGFWDLQRFGAASSLLLSALLDEEIKWTRHRDK